MVTEANAAELNDLQQSLPAVPHDSSNGVARKRAERAQKRQRLNALKTGVYVRVPLGELPKPWTGIRVRVNNFRRDLEEAVLRAHAGEIGIVHAHLIATACRHARQLACCERVLRRAGPPGEETGKLTPETWLMFSDRITRHSEGIDRVLRALGLDRGAADPWKTILTAPQTGQGPDEPKDDADIPQDAADAEAGETLTS